MRQFIATVEGVEEKIREWKSILGERMRIDTIPSFSGFPVRALTFSDFHENVPPSRRIYFSQPHAHEPGATAGMVDAVEQLATGHDLWGKPSKVNREKLFREAIITFNLIGNPHGTSRSPVKKYWDGSRYTNDEFWCWMRGEDPDNPGRMWKRLDEFDTRKIRTPDPIGIVYEQIDEFTWVEPNRSRKSSYFKLFFKMDSEFHYGRWLNLHQTEFVGEPYDCVVLLGIKGLAAGEKLEENIAWGKAIHTAWKAAGFRPMPEPRPLEYTGVQAEYFLKNFGELHERMNIITTEVKNNAPDATPLFQIKAQSIAAMVSITALESSAST